MDLHRGPATETLLLPRGRLRGLLLYFFPYCHPIGPLLLAPPTSNTLTDQIMSAQRLYELDRSSIQFPEQLDGLLRDKEWVEQLKFLPEHELVELAGHLHDVWLISIPTTSHSSTPQILGVLDSRSSPFRKCLRVLQKVCSSRMILPSTYEVSGELSLTSTQPVAFGGFCDVHKGSLGGADVCIKRLRISTTGDRAAVRRVTHPRIFG